MKCQPINLADANAYVSRHHRHNRPVVGARFCVAVQADTEIVGVGILGRPIARMLDDGATAEILRVCTAEDSPTNVCSMIYGALRRAWFALGGGRVVTYTLASEPGCSLRAAGFVRTAELAPSGGWERDGRPREALFTDGTAKVRWESVRRQEVSPS